MASINFFRRKSAGGFLEEFLNSAEFGEVLSQAAYKEIAIYIATSYIANAISKCEIKTYENGKEVKGENYYKLNISPNPNSSGSQFKNKLGMQLVKEGEALMFTANNNAYIADSFSIEKHPFGNNVFENIVVDGESFNSKPWSNNVSHFRLENERARSFIDSVYTDLGSVLAQAIKNYKVSNGLRFKYKTDASEFGTREDIEKFKNETSKKLKSFIEKDFAILPEFTGRNLEQFNIDGKPSNEFISVMNSILELAAEVWKIPKGLMTGSVDDIDKVCKTFIAFAVEPYTSVIEDELTRKLYTYEQWQKGCYVRVDTTTIPYETIFSIADKADKLISSSLLTTNEVRKLIKMDLIDDEFANKHFITKNYAKAEDVLNGFGESGKEEV